jgi:ABC-type branched-subunit amino acid transport system ATPase component
MPLLQIRGLTHYFGGLRAVSNFNLDLEPGELVGIIGPNGAGKTTVFNLITGVYRPTEGEILFNGHNLVGKRSDQIVSLGIARTFQTIRLFKNLSVLDNVRIARFARMSYGVPAAMFRLPKYVREEAETRERALELLETDGAFGAGHLGRLQSPLRPATAAGDRPRAGHGAPPVAPGRARRRDEPGRDCRVDGTDPVDSAAV